MMSVFKRDLSELLGKERSRWFLWTPVFLGGGVGCYFVLPAEPHWGFAIAALLCSLGSVLFGARSAIGLVLSGVIFWCGLGFFLAKARTHYVASPIILKSNKLYVAKGWVEAIQKRGDGRSRILLYLQALSLKRGEVLSPVARPARLRISFRKDQTQLKIGDFIQVDAILRSPPEPVWPGGFDYARHLWFARIGGIGFAVSKPERIKTLSRMPFLLSLKTYGDATRKQIAENIQDVIPGRYGALAVALITGERSYIDEKDLEALRNSGLAHILAISGLHMAIMAGTIYWLIRFILSAFPSVALTVPIKTVAASAALLGALYYLFVSGAGISTQRAFIMTSVMLVAIILKRPAVTLRNIAIAALFILLFKPESIVDVGFQMSFAAAIALVSIYEIFAQSKDRKIREGQIISPPASFPIRYISGIASTTIIAGFAVAPIAVYHFHQINQFGLLGNLMAMPIVGIIIMPVVLIYFLLSPLGLEGYPLKIMEYGLEILMGIADYVSHLPGAVVYVPQIPLVSLVMIVIGGLWLAIWITRWRYLGLFAIGLGMVIAPMIKLPDLIADKEGRIVAVKSKENTLASPKGRAGHYSLQKWMKIYGDARTVKEVQNNKVFRCDIRGCITQLGRYTVSLLKHPVAIDEDCRSADIIISKVDISGSCNQPLIVIDKSRLRRQGVHALYLTGSNIRIDSVDAYRRGRLWNPNSYRAK